MPVHEPAPPDPPAVEQGPSSSSPSARSRPRRLAKLPLWLWLILVTGFAIGVGGLTSNSITGKAEKFRIIVQSSPTIATTTSTTPAPEPTDDPPIATEPTTTLPRPVTTAPQTILFSGTGDGVVDLGPGNRRIFVAAIHDGRSNFIVKSLGVDLQTRSLVVNEIGPYVGVDPLISYGNASDVRYVQVTADGHWTIEVLVDSQLPLFGDSEFSGRGSSVFRYTGRGGVFDVTHDGSSNFIVKAMSGRTSDLLINQIGPYAGELSISRGPIFVIVHADGDWTFAEKVR